jgi:GTP-binding protein YchF
MKIGLTGLPHSGKTTIFNALTNAEVDVQAYATEKTEPNLAVVAVADERVTRLSQMYEPKKTIHATIEMMDLGGMSHDPAKDSALSDQSIPLLKNADALALVVRNYRDDLMGPPNPLADMSRVEEELLFSDLALCEGRLDRIEKSYQRGKKTPQLQVEEKIVRRILEQLNNEKPVRKLPMTKDEQKIIRGFQLLTEKPMMVVLNSNEMIFGDNQTLLDKIGKEYSVIEFAGKFEMELSRLDEEEMTLFMEDMGVTESARDRLTRMAYRTLEYISFFTVGSDEVRAWTLKKGETALEAAGTVHTDLARGFIRAECFSYDDLMECRSEKGVKEKGRLRLEGKNYVVQDGDILNIRYNI